MNYVDILEAGNRSPGFKGEMFYCPVAHIDTFPDPGADTNLISTAFTIKVGMTGFHKIEISNVPEKTPYTQEDAGDADNPVRNGTFSAFHPGSDPAIMFQLNKLKGTECIVLIAEKGNCNQAGDPIYQMIGNKCQGVNLTTTYQNSGTVKGTTIAGQGFAEQLPLFYDATIPGDNP